jgi:hypothetical protein
MKVLFKSFAAAALMSTLAATGSAQNTGAAREAGASGVGAAHSGVSQSGDRPRMPGASHAPNSASAASGRRETAADNRGASAPTDQGMTRGGPENPSGLKKPD